MLSTHALIYRAPGVGQATRSELWKQLLLGHVVAEGARDMLGKLAVVECNRSPFQREHFPPPIAWGRLFRASTSFTRHRLRQVSSIVPSGISHDLGRLTRSLEALIARAVMISPWPLGRRLHALDRPKQGVLGN